MSIHTRASGYCPVYIQDIGVRVKPNFNVPIIGEGMKHETEIAYLKNRLNDMAADISIVIRALVEAGIIEFAEGDIKVKKVKLDEQSDSEQA